MFISLANKIELIGNDVLESFLNTLHSKFRSVMRLDPHDAAQSILNMSPLINKLLDAYGSKKDEKIGRILKLAVSLIDRVSGATTDSGVKAKLAGIKDRMKWFL